ncbi:acyl carrier protein [Amycolatopsis suaedae]|uniref:Acyl carrier protein n=1 Tax=Amycolatopsis suaedae TaxID=2510978 RepID=A0A4Q7JA11_9PSEU|nr:acyl carrier protein [Amycolatopsis suaedae]RZQ64077.1 acyl carrier protein [Amycolatopsis suaedae]
MTAANHVDELRTLICRTLGLDPSELTPSTPFDELGISSRQRVHLLATVEVHFDVALDLDQLDRLVDVDAVAEMIAEAQAAKRTTG